MDNYCIYKDCYKDLKGKYAITAYVGTRLVEKNGLESVFAGYETWLNELIYITDVQEDNYAYNGYNFNKIDGKQIVKANECYFDDLETECISSYDETEKMNFAKVNESGEYIYDINNLAKSIKGYKFDSYKLYIFDNFNGDGYEETSDLNVNYNCSDNLLRLYYTKVINESNETVNIAEIKNIKIKSYFKDLESTTTTISYRVLDTSIAEVDSDGNIKPLKVGETDIIATADGVEYTLHLRVTQDMVTNPDTASPIIMILCVIGILISGTTVYLKEQAN